MQLSGPFFSYTIMVAIYNIINYLFVSSIFSHFFSVGVKPVTFLN
jgi:hypothetical protein